jgi:pyridoxine kinase
MKRIATMQDLSCYGKASLTEALPVLSVLGVETAVLPTALLSTPTSWPHPYFRSLREEEEKIMACWKKEGFTFDGLYIGYLGAVEQISTAEHFIDVFGKGKQIVLDPCMGDNGRLYAGLPGGYPKALRPLCAKADILCPNLTEACLLLGSSSPQRPRKEELKDILKQLAALGPEHVVLTGLSPQPDTIGILAFQKKTNSFFSYSVHKESGRYHGTGDLWASVLAGACVQGVSFEDACFLACDFVASAIRQTPPSSDGKIAFEKRLEALARDFQTILCRT